mmetsp:Transcript_101066/g.123756  ORF Transcript_101066/g.123756 Transcript_101066/m.123756 type:complete len:504 (-) Transcript_101066:25-1536(-)
MRFWFIICILIYIITPAISQSCAKCNDLDPKTGQTVFTTTTVNTFDISQYTCGQIKLLTSFGGQGLLTCNDDADYIEFVITPNSWAIRVLLGGGTAQVSGSCCSASSPYRVCNAPDTQASVDELCRNLGYTTAQLTRSSTNTCPEVLFNTVTQTWTSDFVSSSGSLQYLRCSGCTKPNPPNKCSDEPTQSPSKNPTQFPSTNPSSSPSNNPTVSPSSSPSNSPSTSPSTSPSNTPTISPSKSPTIPPTISPTTDPSLSPTMNPSVTPSMNPTAIPSKTPTQLPTQKPTESPSLMPTESPVTGVEKASQTPFGNKTLTIGMIIIALSLIFCCAVILIACLLLHFKHKKEIEKEKIKAIVSMKSIGMTSIKSVSSPSEFTSIHEIDQQMKYLDTMRKQMIQDGAGAFTGHNNNNSNYYPSDMHPDKIMAINAGLDEALANTNSNIMDGEGGASNEQQNNDGFPENLPNPPEINEDVMYGNTNNYYDDDYEYDPNNDMYQQADTQL